MEPPKRKRRLSRQRRVAPEIRVWWDTRKSKETGCFIWKASLNSKGYAQFWNGKKIQTVHRWAYEFFKGPIPDGHQIDHLCFNKKCWNPEHLEAVTGSTNVQRFWDNHPEADEHKKHRSEALKKHHRQAKS